MKRAVPVTDACTELDWPALLTPVMYVPLN
jgi:hypothetical protein